MELFTWEGSVFLYPGDVYLCTLICLLVWMCFILKDWKYTKNTKVKISRCPVSCILKMVSSFIRIKPTIKSVPN